jgi:heptosyltransferase-2
MEENTKKILIRGVNWIGDAILIIPAIRAIRNAYPQAHISLLIKPWVFDIFKQNPDINEIILYDERFKGFTGRLKLAKLLRLKKFNMAILLQNAFDAALISWLSRIPERIGYKRHWRGPLLTKAIPVDKEILKQHQVYYYLNLLKKIGLDSVEPQPYIYLTDDERRYAKKLLNTSLSTHHVSPVVGINPGATYGSAKRWLPERFAELIQRIINELNGSVIIFGSQSETEIVNKIVKEVNIQNTKHPSPLAPHLSPILNMTGKTTLRELAALISECDVFITNDSGPMHMASALFVPIVAIFGSTDEAVTGPLGEGHRIINKKLSCAPCLKRECPEGHLRCMTEITTNDVFNAVRETLPQKRAVFIDRDGTIIEDRGYLNNFNDLVIFPDAKENLQRLKEAGFKLICITNQSGIARGIVKEDFVRIVNAYLQKTLDIDDFYYCPHHPDEGCPCRKPEPMLLLKARLKHGINLKASYIIGDKESDVLLAKKVGATGVLLSPASVPLNTNASYVAKNLKESINWILEREEL